MNSDDLRDAILDALDVRSGRDGDHDPYSALCAMFDLAHALYWLDPNSVPSSWGFRPAPYGSIDYADCAESVEDGACGLHCGECWAPREVLAVCGVALDGPYDTPERWATADRAIEAMVAVGDELEPYAVLSDV